LPSLIVFPSFLVFSSLWQAHEGRINATSVLLEGSRHMSGGARVEVDLSYLNQQKQSYSLFPGQIVAVEGMNCSGRKLVAQRICEGAAHAPVKSTVSDLIKFHHGDDFQGGVPLQIVTASGPFTCSDNLEYEPLLDLIRMVSQTKPDVVILTGPFVDMRHQAVAAGQTTLEYEHENGEKEEILVSFEAFFANKIAGLLEELYGSDDSIQTQFILVPSLDDATTEWVYPQAPFTDRRPGGGTNLKIPGADDVEVGTLGLDHIETVGRGEGGTRRVHCVSNPCTLKINEVVIGVTATDVLFHMSADETNANLEVGSRMGRIAQHLLQQRSYYTLFPGSSNANLDLKRMDQWKMPCAPDLLILPSKLTPFTSTVLDNSTVVINPGLLTRATVGGTYAVVNVHPISRDTLENAGGDDVEMKHNLQDRTCVEIKRI
jgi:DNA polymerase alpha subunit B